MLHRKTLTRALWALGAMSLLASAASADVNGGFTITASTGDVGNRQTASWDFEATWDPSLTDPETGMVGGWTWSTSTPIVLEADGVSYGVLSPDGQESCVDIFEDPVVSLNFAVQAGPNTTTFSIASALLSFPTIATPSGKATANFTVTDTNSDTAQLTGIGATGGGYLAQYNGWAATLSGTTFTEAQNSVTVAVPNGTTTSPYNQPLIPIGTSVSDMSSLISFDLSAGDLASGTTRYEIVPEPASVALLLLGAALLRRRN